MVVQDADAPIPSPFLHAAFYGIPASVTSLTETDIPDTQVQPSKQPCTKFKAIENMANTLYIPPRPPAEHGPHRYFFQVRPT